VAEAPTPVDAEAEARAEEHRGRAHQVAHVIYGAVIAETLLVAADDSEGAGELFRTLIATGLVLWLAHAFAAAMGHAITTKQHLRPASVRACMVDQVALLLGFLVPLPAIALGIFDVLGDARAADVAIAMSLVMLLVVGTGLGRAAGMRWPAALLGGLIYPALGAVVIGLEVAVKH
jgi:hypothetical protein